MDSNSTRAFTGDELERIRSVAIDICQSEKPGSKRLKRMLRYRARAEEELGKAQANLAYNILWTYVRTFEDGLAAAGRKSLVARLKEQWVVVAPCSVVVAIFLWWIIPRLAALTAGPNAAAISTHHGEEQTGDPEGSLGSSDDGSEDQ